MKIQATVEVPYGDTCVDGECDFLLLLTDEDTSKCALFNTNLDPASDKCCPQCIKAKEYYKQIGNT